MAGLFFLVIGGKARIVPLRLAQISARSRSGQNFWNIPPRSGVLSPRAIEENHDA